MISDARLTPFAPGSSSCCAASIVVCDEVEAASEGCSSEPDSPSMQPDHQFLGITPECRQALCTKLDVTQRGIVKHRKGAGQEQDTFALAKIVERHCVASTSPLRGIPQPLTSHVLLLDALLFFFNSSPLIIMEILDALTNAVSMAGAPAGCRPSSHNPCASLNSSRPRLVDCIDSLRQLMSSLATSVVNPANLQQIATCHDRASLCLQMHASKHIIQQPQGSLTIKIATDNSATSHNAHPTMRHFSVHARGEIRTGVRHEGSVISTGAKRTGLQADKQLVCSPLDLRRRVAQPCPRCSHATGCKNCRQQHRQIRVRRIPAGRRD